jgi:hypothetical protein
MHARRVEGVNLECPSNWHDELDYKSACLWTDNTTSSSMSPKKGLSKFGMIKNPDLRGRIGLLRMPIQQIHFGCGTSAIC